MEENGYELTPFEGIHLEPLGLYSEGLGSTDEISDGANIAIPPNDATNRGRALALLADAGLISLPEDVEPTAATPRRTSSTTP